jgi:hypothetical protein
MADDASKLQLTLASIAFFGPRSRDVVRDFESSEDRQQTLCVSVQTFTAAANRVAHRLVNGFCG